MESHGGDALSPDELEAARRRYTQKNREYGRRPKAKSKVRCGKCGAPVEDITGDIAAFRENRRGPVEGGAPVDRIRLDGKRCEVPCRRGCPARYVYYMRDFWDARARAVAEQRDVILGVDLG